MLTNLRHFFYCTYLLSIEIFSVSRMNQDGNLVEKSLLWFRIKWWDSTVIGDNSANTLKIQIKLSASDFESRLKSWGSG